MERTFEYIETEAIRTPLEVKDSFEFRPDRGFHWAQGVCFWCLRKIGAYRRDERVSYRKHTISPDLFIDRLMKQRAYLLKEFNMSPTRLFIGAEDFSEIMSQPETTHVLQFQTTYDWYKDGSIKIMGLDVTVIPWMRGVIVLP